MSKPTVISFLLDESGSMSSWQMTTIIGFNSYVDTLRGTDKEVDVTCSLVKFMDMGVYRPAFSNIRIDKVPYLDQTTYQPSGGTDINYALSRCIEETEAYARSRGDNPNIVIVLQTDGECSADQKLKPTIKKKQEEGWRFILMGCGVDVSRYGNGVGISSDTITSYDGQKTEEAFENLAKNTVRYVHSGSDTDLSYTEEQRRKQKA